jgi:hypothetical protein
MREETSQSRNWNLQDERYSTIRLLLPLYWSKTTHRMNEKCNDLSMQSTPQDMKGISINFTRMSRESKSISLFHENARNASFKLHSTPVYNC